MSALKPGDLAIVIRGHCTQQEKAIGGRIVKVDLISSEQLMMACGACSEVFVRDNWATVLPSHGHPRVHPVAWLKKIEPLSEPEQDMIRFEEWHPRRYRAPVDA